MAWPPEYITLLNSALLWCTENNVKIIRKNGHIVMTHHLANINLYHDLTLMFNNEEDLLAYTLKFGETLE